MKELFGKKNIPGFALFVLLIISIAAIVISHNAFAISFITACVMVIFEALLAALLNKIPIWIHGIVFIAQIVAGIISKHIAFMIFMVVIYVLSLAFLYIWSKNE